MNLPTRREVVRLDLRLDDSFDRLLHAEPGIHLQVFKARGEDDAVWQALSRADVYHVSSAKDELPAHWFVKQPLIERCPKLALVTTYGAGYDTVDVDACTRAGIAVVNQSGSNAHAVCEHAFGLMLTLLRRISECNLQLRRGGPFTRQDFIGDDLEGRTLGLVGFGHIGSRMAQIARVFNMDVIASDPFVSSEKIAQGGAAKVELPELLRRSDVVSVHCPLEAATAHLFDAAAFAAMKKGALFISTARGGIHDEAALYTALKSGHLSGAGLDVWNVEPPPADHPLLTLGNVIATYHIAGVTKGARRSMAAMAVTQMLGALRGQQPANLVNPQVWDRFVQRLAAN